MTKSNIETSSSICKILKQETENYQTKIIKQHKKAIVALRVSLEGWKELKQQVCNENNVVNSKYLS